MSMKLTTTDASLGKSAFFLVQDAEIMTHEQRVITLEGHIIALKRELNKWNRCRLVRFLQWLGILPNLEI